MITVDRLKELLGYDPVTGVFWWKVSRRRVKAGSVAGSPHSEGYLQIMIDGREYLAHRLAWLYAHGEWPAEQIDHINNDPTDNRLANLREAKQSQNQKNMRQRSDNTSGFKGVSWYKRHKKWIARIRYEGKLHHLGYFDTPEAAHAAYCRAALRIAGEFANFGHGCAVLQPKRWEKPSFEIINSWSM